MATKPTNEQARLHLQVYDLRRESRLRRARDWLQNNYTPQTIEDAFRSSPLGADSGGFVAMVFSYWEQTCALLN